MALLTLRNLSLSYGDPPLIDGIDLSIESGERICLLGRNAFLEPNNARDHHDPALIATALRSHYPAAAEPLSSERALPAYSLTFSFASLGG